MAIEHKIMEAMETAEKELNNGNYDSVVQVCIPFVKNRIAIPHAYIYISTALMELAAKQEDGSEAYNLLGMSYSTSLLGLMLCDTDNHQDQSSMLNFLRGKTLYLACNAEFNPEEMLFEKRTSNEAIVLDALQSLEQAVDLPDYLTGERERMLRMLKERVKSIDSTLTRLHQINKKVGAFIDSLELMTTMQSLSDEKNAMMKIAQKQQTLYKEAEKMNQVDSNDQLKNLTNYAAGLFLLSIGKGQDATDAFSMVKDWNPGNVLGSGKKMARALLTAN